MLKDIKAYFLSSDCEHSIFWKNWNASSVHVFRTFLWFEVGSSQWYNNDATFFFAAITDENLWLFAHVVNQICSNCELKLLSVVL